METSEFNEILADRLSRFKAHDDLTFVSDRWLDTSDNPNADNFGLTEKDVEELTAKAAQDHEISFIVHRGGKFDLLMEEEFVAVGPDEEETVVASWGYAPNVLEVLVKAARKAEKLAEEFPEVEFSVSAGDKTWHGRPVLWAIASRDADFDADKLCDALSTGLPLAAFEQADIETIFGDRLDELLEHTGTQAVSQPSMK